MHRHLIILMGLWLGFGTVAYAQTKLKLSAIKPGTERVQLINNGDFQLQGPLVGGNYPTPTDWSRGGDIFASAGTNTVTVNGAVVAKAQVDGGAPVAGYNQSVTLEPATAYVFSAYLWNMGNVTNRVNTVIDFADAPGEPQVVVNFSDSEADKGYFVYRSFNTTTTGTNITVRAFYDGLAGTGTAPGYFPVATQWDNLAITKASEFIAPQASNSTATLRPLVTVVSPTNNALLYPDNLTPNVTLTASATDLDGSITNVQFFAGTNKLGESFSAPWSITWNSPPSGGQVLTAVAADNTGATTRSAPVSVLVSSSVTTNIPGSTFTISLVDSNVVISWPASNPPVFVQTASNLVAPVVWQKVTNAIVVVSNLNTLTLPVNAPQRFFRFVPEVDPSTMYHKLLMGYQGWFSCPGDGSPVNQWVHWFNGPPTVGNLQMDMWPDTSEFDADELFTTGLTYSNGTPAKLYSAYNQKSVLRHFKWMQDNHLDGVFFQRFLSDLPGGNLSVLRNQVAVNVRVGAETYGRVFAIMYDISGYPTNTLISKLTNDWLYLVNTQHVTNSPAYLHHHGKPVVTIWGFGFSGRDDTPQQAQQAIDWFKAAGCTVMGGVPSNWRTLNGDAQTNPGWSNAFRSFDVISPWSVGRYGNNAGADNYRLSVTVPDLADCTNHGIDYLPVVFPGFSWTNLNSGPYNQIPRNGGNFYWRQVYNAVRSGCTMIYGAMFDEVNEGTAMFKMAATAADQPVGADLVPLNIDGTNVPNDWYLKLADQAGKMLRGEIPEQSALPISP